MAHATPSHVHLRTVREGTLHGRPSIAVMGREQDPIERVSSALTPAEVSNAGAAALAATDHRCHCVQFYESDARLAKSVAAYFEPVLASGDACLMIATESHRDAVNALIEDSGIDL